MTTLIAHVLGGVVLTTHTDRRTRKQALHLAIPSSKREGYGQCWQIAGLFPPGLSRHGGNQAGDERQEAGTDEVELWSPASPASHLAWEPNLDAGRSQKVGSPSVGAGDAGLLLCA